MKGLKFIILIENELIKEGYIKKETQKGKFGINFNFTRFPEWNKYIFDYNNVNQEDITKLFYSSIT